MGMTRRQPRILLAGLLLLSALPMLAERKPVSAQIQLPHNYYYPEMYLPQLTSGPSALTRATITIIETVINFDNSGVSGTISPR